jgi:hypothetical protein
VTGEITRQSTRGWAGRRARVVAAVVAVVLVGAGVAVALRGNGSDPPAPRARPTAIGATASTTTGTGSPSPTLSETPEPPALPDAATKPTRAGAAAFLRYFFAIYNYSFASLDSSAIERISAESCRFCQGVRKDVQSAKEQGLRFEGAEIAVVAAVAAPGEARKGLVVNGSIDQRVGRSVDRSGAIRRELAAANGVRVDAGVRWTDRGWIVFAVALPESR